MKISLNVDTSRWLELPRLVDGSEEARQWEEAVLADMKVAWRGALDAPSEPFVREALRNGLRRVSDDDSVTLQYWPDASIVNAIVHVSAAPFAPDEPRQVVPLADMLFVTQPVVEMFDTAHLGDGVEARYLTTIGEQPPIRVAGVNYLFQNEFGYVAVGVEPTLPSLVGILLEPLREVVRGIQIIDDAEGNWQRASVDESTLPHRGEEWNVDAGREPELSAHAAQ
tara:strand:+ start:24737 stop:25411 length:675 start_codon:yes stop_codon:yes gene_type:complete